MSELHENPAPTVPLILAASLVVLSLIGVTWQKFVVAPNAQTATSSRAVVQHRTLQFVDGEAGAVLVMDVDSGLVLDTLAAGEGGFLRGTLRGLVRERRTMGASMDAAFALELLSDGTAVLRDLATRREIDLRAFGAVNADNFLRYLPPVQMVTEQGD